MRPALTKFTAVMSVLIPLSLLLLTSRSARAEECDWADCGPGDSWSYEMPPCEVEHKVQCEEQCRSEFGPEFKRCVRHCLEGMCATPATPSSANRAAEDSFACLIVESDPCVQDCSSVGGSSVPRCRRDCLTRKCPNSSPLDAADEASSPGKLKCKRCAKEHEEECRRTCGAGVSMDPAGRGSALLGLGCEKACITAQCGMGCVF